MRTKAPTPSAKKASLIQEISDDASGDSDDESGEDVAINVVKEDLTHRPSGDAGKAVKVAIEESSEEEEAEQGQVTPVTPVAVESATDFDDLD